MEWRLFDEGTTPVFTTYEFFQSHPWIDPAHQVGHAERIDMVVAAFTGLYGEVTPELESLCDLGCGDGSFLERALGAVPHMKMWGFDAGRQNVEIAQKKGLDVRRADIVNDGLHVGEIVVLTEVLEHLVDPHGFLSRGLPAKWLIATSPSGESADWHYEHHAWAWNRAGFCDMIEGAGWAVRAYRETVALNVVAFGPTYDVRQPSFQCIVAEKK